MSRTDLIADAFTIIRNAVRAKKEEAYIPYSKSLSEICDILKNSDYLQDHKAVDLGKFRKIKVYLRYEGKENAIRQIKKVSTSGRRVYVKKDTVPSVLQGHGIAIVSTSSGILSGEEAKAKGVGGELIGKVW